jgi:MYXO-CTERM domain-containing protein
MRTRIFGFALLLATSIGCDGTSIVALRTTDDPCVNGPSTTDASQDATASQADAAPEGSASEASLDAASDGDGSGGQRGPHGGTWPTYAHDYQRTSRADGSGAITSPTVAWTKNMGGVLGPGQGAVGDVDGDGRPNVVAISGGRATATNPDGSTLWQGSLVGARAVLGIWNLDGVGAPEVVIDTPGGVQVLDGATGKLQTTLPTSVPAAGAFAPEGAKGGILLISMTLTQLAAYDFRQGLQVSSPLWTTNEEDPVQVDIGDVDGDGTLDLVRALNQGFQVLDPLTGQVKYQDTLPSVGFVYSFRLANVDGKPGLEIVVIDPSYIYSPSTGIYVLGVSQGALVTLWSQSVTTNVALSAQFTTVAGAVADLDGDGTKEAVYSQWDATSQTWTTHIVDAVTGTSIASVAGEVVQAVADLDGNGKSEIVTRSNPLADMTPPRSDVRVYDFASRSVPPAARPWVLTNAHVMTAGDPIVANFDGATGLEVLVGVDPKNSGADTELAVLRGDGSLASTWAVPANVTPSVLWSGGGLTSASSHADVLEVGDDGLARILSSTLAQSVSFATGTYANWLNVHGLDANRTILAMATSNRDLLWLDGTHLHGDGTPYQLAHHPGVVDSSGFAAAGAGLDPMTLLAGKSPTLVAYEQGETAITMVGMDTSGVESWRTPLAAGASILMPGPYAQDLTGDGVPDLIVPLFNINSLESFAVFDGATGAIVRSTPLQTIYPGGDQTMVGSLVDVNGDGVPDLVIPLHDVGSVAIDLSKDPMTSLWTIGSPPAISGTIAASQVDLQGTSLLRFNGNVGVGPYAHYSLSGAVLAYQDQGLQFLDGTDRNGVAFVQRTPGASIFDMVSAGTSGVGLSRVRRIAGDTIATVWTVYAAGGAVTSTQPAQAFALHDPIALDVDGDGTDEVVFGSDDGWLYALHASDGSLAFSLNLGAPVLHVIAADIDLDPAVELEASLGDGRLVAIDGAGNYTAVRDPPSDAGGGDAGDAGAGDAGDAGVSEAGGPGTGGSDASGNCGSPDAGATDGATSGCACHAVTGAGDTDIGALALLGVLAGGAARRRMRRAAREFRSSDQRV